MAKANRQARLQRSTRREMAREALRVHIDGIKQIDGINECIALAEQAFMYGDVSGIPALRLRFDSHMALLNKVLPSPRQVELSSNDQHGPVLILDMVGAQPVHPPQLEVLDGEIVGAEESRERSDLEDLCS